MRTKKIHKGFAPPPIKVNDNGEERKIGWEFEFGNLTVDETVRIISELYGGTVDSGNKYVQTIKGTQLGEFTVKFDTGLLTKKSYRKVFQALGIDFTQWGLDQKKWEDHIEEIIARLGSNLIPMEVVSPPIPLSEMEELESLRKRLFQAGAQGTTESFAYAFGLHINPEVPSTETKSIIRHLQAFIVLYQWILHSSNIDISRRLTHFINPFPKEYIELVLSTDYQPDIESFIRDYHKYNPDRNRPLDLYPLLRFLHEDQIDQLEGLGPVSSRPTYHYRLPNCLIDQGEWKLSVPWNKWVEVELLAQDENALKEIFQMYWKSYHSTMIGFNQKWQNIINNWLTYEH